MCGNGQECRDQEKRHMTKMSRICVKRMSVWGAGIHPLLYKSRFLECLKNSVYVERRNEESMKGRKDKKGELTTITKIIVP